MRFKMNIKLGTLLLIASIAGCTADESAMLHPVLNYPDAPKDFKSESSIVIYGQNFANNPYRMAAFIAHPQNTSKYYRAITLSTTQIPSLYIQCKTPGNSGPYSSGYQYATGFLKEKNFESGKFYEISCGRPDFNHVTFIVTETNKIAFEDEIADKRKDKPKQNEKTSKGDAGAVHFYADKEYETVISPKSPTKKVKLYTSIIDMESGFWGEKYKKELHLKGNVSQIGVGCGLWGNDYIQINVIGKFNAGHSYEMKCLVDEGGLPKVGYQELKL